MKGLRAASWILAFALALPTGTLAQQPADHAARVDRIFGTWSATDVPGCAVGVARAGQAILSQAYGMADLER